MEHDSQLNMKVSIRTVTECEKKKKETEQDCEWKSDFVMGKYLTHCFSPNLFIFLKGKSFSYKTASKHSFKRCKHLSDNVSRRSFQSKDKAS